MVLRDDGELWAASSDAELLAAATANPEAFGVFYQRHARVVLGFFYRRTTCAQTSADLTAETFAAAFVSRARYRDNGTPARAWLLGIARHQISRSFRRSRLPDRSRRRLGIERVAVDDLSYERIEALADFAPLRQAVREAMATLTPKLAEAVSLRVGLDLPYPEVAAGWAPPKAPPGPGWPAVSPTLWTTWRPHEQRRHPRPERSSRTTDSGHR